MIIIYNNNIIYSVYKLTKSVLLNKKNIKAYIFDNNDNNNNYTNIIVLKFK